MTIQLEKLVSRLELDNRGFKAGLIGAAAGITALVGGMVVAVKATMDWAKDLDSLGDVMDGSNKQFAALAFVARKSGVGVDALTKANGFLNKGLLKSNGSLDVIGRKLQSYGIKVKDANNNVKDSVQLTDEIANKYKSLATQQERINFLTDIYGKQGVQLVDFFDTLNSEGGISAVTKKVEALGLAIDPARYEKFNRNIEELKLIGLGLAVSFTEKIMPALEGFLGWLNTVAQSSKFKEIKDKISELFDFGKDGKTKFDIKNTDAAKSLDTKLTGLINSMDWKGLGDKFADKLDEFIANGIKGKDFSQSENAVNKAFGDFLFGATGSDFWSKFGIHIGTGFGGSIVQAQPKLNVPAMKMGSEIGASLVKGFALLKPAFYASITGMASSIDARLRDIAKTFYNRASAWAQQMIAGFKGGLPGLLSAIAGMVQSINAELRKIITSFNVNVAVGSVTGVTSSANLGGTSSGKNIKSAGKGGKRATGGATLAGHAYDTVELKKPEVFTPFTAGRIDPKKDQNVIVDINYNKLARAMTQQRLKGLA